MKTKTLTLLTAMVLISLMITSNALAQQSKNTSQTNTLLNKDSNYTYKIIDEPNGQFSYEILSNAKPVFHQSLSFASTTQTPIIIKKQQAQKAALLSINKIKNGMPPALTNRDMKALAIN